MVEIRWTNRGNRCDRHCDERERGVGVRHEHEVAVFVAADRAIAMTSKFDN